MTAAADPAALLRLADEAGWPVLAEPSSGARPGPARWPRTSTCSTPRVRGAAPAGPDRLAGRPGLSRGQLGYLRRLAVRRAPRGTWWSPRGRGAGRTRARTATDVAAAVRLARRRAGRHRVAGAGGPRTRRRGAAAAAILDADDALTEPRLARDLAAALPDGALLWAASSLPIRDLDRQMAPRAGVTVLASRGASGIDGLVSSASGAALAHQRAGGGPAVALLGDLAFLHDPPGLFAGPDEPRPDLVVVVANNDGGGIFSLLEQAAFPASFERVFGTPHGGALGPAAAAAAGLPAMTLDRASGLAGALRGDGQRPGAGIRVVEVRNSRAAGRRCAAGCARRARPRRG